MREFKYFDTLLIVNAIVVTFVLFMKISWGFSAPGILDGLYEVQQTSLSQGHAYLVPGPPRVYYHDSSMFQGHAYLYFGPLPSIILWICSIPFARFIAHYLVTALFLFCFVYVLQRLVAEVVNASLRTDTGSSRWWCVSSLLLLWGLLFVPPLPGTQFGFFCPDFYIYQQQIVFGLGLGMAGVLTLARIEPKHASGHVAVAGLLFALAAWVRATWLVAAGGVVAASLILQIVKLRRNGQKSWKVWELGCSFAGAALLVVLLLWNFIRFDSFTDFGVFFRQNCADDHMFRLSTGFFSVQAKILNFLMNLLTYYTSPAILEASGLAQKTFTNNGFLSGGFFSIAPQWLFAVVLLPVSLYRICTVKRSLVPLFLVLCAALAYMNVMLTGVPPASAPRYFLECYPFIMLTLLAGLLAALTPRLGIVCMIAFLGLQFVQGGLDGTCGNPNLRLLDNGPNTPRGINERFNRDPGLDTFIVNGAVWFRGGIDSREFSTLRPYNGIGIYPTRSGRMRASDVSAIYIIPEQQTEVSRPPSRDILEIRGVRSRMPGRLTLYCEGLRVGSLQISPDQDSGAAFDIPVRLRDGLPLQIMMVFLAEGQTHLPPHPYPFLPWQFGSLRLQRHDRATDR